MQVKHKSSCLFPIPSQPSHLVDRRIQQQPSGPVRLQPVHFQLFPSWLGRRVVPSFLTGAIILPSTMTTRTLANHHSIISHLII